jgi:3-dehydroquinate synthase
MLESGFGRDTVVVALGGGVAGDLGGFVAATYLRGVPCVQIPTSLLAMIDSSVGGKTGVDTPHGKNLVGSFHQPCVVVGDMSTLGTLSDRHLSAGTAEALKHGAISDADYLTWLVENHHRVLQRDPETLVRLVRRSVEIKAEVVADDELERGRRAILNFGHTLGHAVESASDFELVHGEAVAIGMVAEARLGTDLGITAADTGTSLARAAEAFRLPTGLPSGAGAEGLLDTIALDKKNRAATVRFALLEQVGRVARDAGGQWTHAVSDSAIRDAVARMT